MGRADGPDEDAMRAVTFRIEPPSGTHPAYRMFTTEADVSRDRISQVNVLDDGTMILLEGLSGDLSRVNRILADRTDVLDYSLSATDGGGVLYAHVRPPPAVERFLTLPRTHEVFFEFPIEGTGDGALRVVMIGETNAALRRALADVPAEMTTTVERIGSHAADGSVVDELLTDRQREVAAAAVDLGYYEVPRAATLTEVADRVGLSVATVGEHLQKVESRLIGWLLR